ncbi:MAG TPA: Ig-like domain-containing protein [Chloroflexota bacterium]
MSSLVRFDRLIVAAIVALGLIIAALSVASARLGPSVDSVSLAETLDGTSVNTQIGITFTSPMRPRTVERGFHISPNVAGDFSWVGNEVLFSPRRALRYDQTYTVTLSTSAQDTDGKGLFRAFRRSFRTQSEHVLYLGTEGAEKNSLVLASTSGAHRSLGGGRGLVTDFSLSFDRTLAVFVRRGASGERPDEIWLLSVDDGSTQRMFRRPDWNISQPHFSPDGKYIVFLATNVRMCRKYYGCFRDTSGPIIEMLDLRSHRVQPFRSASDVPITNFIDFSPAGQVAYTDLGSALTLAQPNGSGVIHVPNQGNSLEFAGFDTAGDKAAFVGQTASSTGGDILIYDRGKYLDVSRSVYDSSTPALSNSGKSVAYAAYRGEQGIEPLYGINVYSFGSRKTLKLTAERGWSDWTPAWSPDDRYVAFVRSQPQEAMYMGSGEIWVVRGDGSQAHPLGGIGKNPQWVA